MQNPTIKQALSVCQQKAWVKNFCIGIHSPFANYWTLINSKCSPKMLSEQGETPCKLAIKKPISFPNASADPANSDKGKNEGRQKEGEIGRERERETETSFHACAVFRLFIIIQDKSCWWYCTHHSVLSASAACNPPPPPPSPAHPPQQTFNQTLFSSAAPECLLNVAISERNPPFSLSLPQGGSSLLNKPSVCHRPCVGVNALTLPRLHT